MMMGQRIFWSFGFILSRIRSVGQAVQMENTGKQNSKSKNVGFERFQE